MKRTFQYITILLLLSNNCIGQNQTWYFGNNAGIKFNGTGLPTAFGTASTNPIKTLEGCAVIHDKDGNMIIASDGVTVYNKNLAIMQGGIGLNGNASATQSAVIIPIPGCNCNKYFVFTVADINNRNTLGAQYSVIDMTKNGGLGEVVAKNIGLINNAQPVERKDQISERLTSVKDGKGGYWVIFQSALTSKFYSFHITASSITDCNNPKVSTETATANLVISISSFNYSDNTLGQMKVSPDGSKLAMATWYTKVNLFDFNRTTGKVTYDKAISGFDCNTYGVEFSPNSKYLYVTEAYVFPNTDADLIRFDLGSINTWADRKIIKTLHTAAGNSWYYRFGSLQLGPDRRIYVANCTISNGMTPGSSNQENKIFYIEDTEADEPVTGEITLPVNSYSYLSLPTMIPDFRDCADPCNKCHNVSVGWNNKNYFMTKDTTVKIGCHTPVNLTTNFTCSPNPSTPVLGVSVKDKNGNTAAFAQHTTMTNFLLSNGPDKELHFTYYFGTAATAAIPADTCDRITITIIDTCFVPCACAPAPDVFYSIGNNFAKSKKADCASNKKIDIKCSEQINVWGSSNCTGDDCTAQNVTVSVSGPGVNYTTKEEETGLSFIPLQKGDYTVTVTGTCNGSTCNPCRIIFHVEECICPPPPCCKTPVQVTFNEEDAKFIYGAQTRLSIPLQLNGGTNKFTQVRADVTGFNIYSDNIQCMDCYDDSQMWGSIYSASLDGFAPTYPGRNIGSNVNTREVVFNTNDARALDNNLQLHLYLPQATTFSCCNVYADIYIKITYRDNNCNECDTMIAVRASLLKPGGSKEPPGELPVGRAKNIKATGAIGIPATPDNGRLGKRITGL